MTRSQLYSAITPCGGISFTALQYAISNTVYTIDPSIQLVLLGRVSQTGKLSREDWILWAKSITYVNNSPLNGDTIQSWLSGKCSLTAQELKTFLNYAQFIDGSEPTYILSQSGDIVVAQ